MTQVGEVPGATRIVFGTDGWRARIAEDFTYDKTRNVYICPAFNILTTTGKIMNGEILFYRASTLDCAACAFGARCCPKEPSRKLLRSIYEEARDVARAIAETDAFEAVAEDAHLDAVANHHSFIPLPGDDQHDGP